MALARTGIEPQFMSQPHEPLQRIAPDVKLGRDVRIFSFTNLYGCEIGGDVKIGSFVEIQ